jgi:hypothetical protein
VQGADAEAVELDRRKPLLWQAAPEPGRRLASHGQKRCNRLVVETRQREANGSERRIIEPLDVVDGEAERSVCGNESQGREESGRHRTFVDLRL